MSSAPSYATVEDPALRTKRRKLAPLIVEELLPHTQG